MGRFRGGKELVYLDATDHLTAVRASQGDGVNVTGGRARQALHQGLRHPQSVARLRSPGTRLGSFKILSAPGEGGMGCGELSG